MIWLNAAIDTPEITVIKTKPTFITCLSFLELLSMKILGRWMDMMKGWRSGMKKQMPTLEQFAKIVRTNNKRLQKLYDDLAYARYLMYAAQGVDYSKPSIQNSTPQYDKISIDLDRIDRIEKKILYYETMYSLWGKWQKAMTPRETDVFHKHYMQDKKVADISAELMISQVRIYTLINQLLIKYGKFSKENSQYL